MKIIYNSTNLKKEIKDTQNLGFVPTMGSIHRGHEYLIKNSKKQCKNTLVSIFINPTQFNNLSDLRNYPKNIKRDLNTLRKLKVDIVFLPKINDVYKSKRRKKITLNKNDKILCAKYRKGHFEGVIDVMDRLTKLISPKKIFMGEKDFQQLYLVKKFIEKKYPCKIINCNTIRDNRSVALSSRNSLISRKSLIVASKIVKELKIIKKNLKKQNNFKRYLKIKEKYLVEKYQIKIEYLELRNSKNLKNSNTLNNSRIFIGYYIENIRLIDNL